MTRTQLISKVFRIFDDRAVTWLKSENPALSGRKPIDVLEDNDAAEVKELENVLGRIEHGVFE